MIEFRAMVRVFLTVTALLSLTVVLPAASLQDATKKEFTSYQRKVESELTWTPAYTDLKAGEVKIEPGNGDGSIEVEKGIVHDWVAAAVVKDATVDDVLAVLRDYASYKEVYEPEVVDSRVLSHSGNDWQVRLTMYKKKVLSATLVGDFDVKYRNLGSGRWNMVSRSTRIAELEDGKELPVGEDQGFLWRLNAYWLVEPRADGVYVEVRSVSLSRGIPFGFGVVVGPFVNGVPRESLQDTMDHTVQALSRRSASAAATREELAASEERSGPAADSARSFR